MKAKDNTYLRAIADTDLVINRDGFAYRKGKRVGNIKPSGYVTLKYKLRTLAIHRLVALKYVPGYKPGLQVNHKDGNKSNNAATNLEWVTSSGNIQHRMKVLGWKPVGCHKTNSTDHEWIARMLSRGVKQRSVASCLGITQTAVSKIRKRYVENNSVPRS